MNSLSSWPTRALPLRDLPSGHPNFMDQTGDPTVPAPVDQATRSPENVRRPAPRPPADRGHARSGGTDTSGSQFFIVAWATGQSTPTCRVAATRHRPDHSVFSVVQTIGDADRRVRGTARRDPTHPLRHHPRACRALRSRPWPYPVPPAADGSSPQQRQVRPGATDGDRHRQALHGHHGDVARHHGHRPRSRWPHPRR